MSVVWQKFLFVLTLNKNHPRIKQIYDIGS